MMYSRRANLRRWRADIPVKQLEQTRFQALWQDVSWQPWKLLPGIDHFSGVLSGGVAEGRLTLRLNDSALPYGDMFRARWKLAAHMVR